MDKFDEYKFFAESTQHLSERRQAATGTYLTVNTALFAVLAFLVKDAEFSGWQLAAAAVPLFLVGILACGIWFKIIEHYRELIRWRYDQLVAMEAELADSHRIYTREAESFFRPGNEKLGFSRMEKRLPQLFMLLYVIYGVGVVIAAGI